MPSANRPFFTSFFAAFRAHSAHPALPKPSQPSSYASTSNSPPGSPSGGSGTPSRSIHTTKTVSAAAASAAGASVSVQPQGQTHLPFHARPSSPVNIPAAVASAGASTGATSPFAGVSRSRTPSATRTGAGIAVGATAARRGSFVDDGASSDGSVGGRGRATAPLGAGRDKWYIGGRTAAGEERYYKLGVVRRYRSCDRLSLDRLSL